MQNEDCRKMNRQMGSSLKTDTKDPYNIVGWRQQDGDTTPCMFDCTIRRKKKDQKGKKKEEKYAQSCKVSHSYSCK